MVLDSTRSECSKCAKNGKYGKGHGIGISYNSLDWNHKVEKYADKVMQY